MCHQKVEKMPFYYLHESDSTNYVSYIGFDSNTISQRMSHWRSEEVVLGLSVCCSLS